MLHDLLFLLILQNAGGLIPTDNEVMIVCVRVCVVHP